MTKESYDLVMKDLAGIEDFMKEQVELYFDLTVQELEKYGYTEEHGMEAIFKGKDPKGEVKRYYLQKFQGADPVVRPILNG